MSYYISFPKIKEKVTFFRKVALGPTNYIAPNLTLLTNSLIWVKFIFSCLLHKNINLDETKDTNEIILNPEFGAYNRVLVWSFEYVSRNIDPSSGILIARDWNYGKKAREKNRDFFNFIGLGRFIKDILDEKYSAKFLNDAKKYSEGNFSEVSKDFFLLEEKFKKNVIGVNLSNFPIKSFFKEIFSVLKPEHFRTRRDEFVSMFITIFLKKFREVSGLEKSGIIDDHPIYHYVNFLKGLKIFSKEDLLETFKGNEKSLHHVFPEPELLKPILSDEGFDAFLILKLLKERAPSHFHSFVIASYLKKRNINFKFNYLNIYEKLHTSDFSTHIKNLEKALSLFGTNFCPLKLDYKLLKFLAIWWEYYQFAFVGEVITRTIHELLLENSTKEEIRKKISDEDLEILCQFLKNYKSSTVDYVEVFKKDENAEEILLQLEEMEDKVEINSLFEYLFKQVALQNSKEYASYPFFPSLDSFEKWVDELLRIFKI